MTQYLYLEKCNFFLDQFIKRRKYPKIKMFTFNSIIYFYFSKKTKPAAQAPF